MIRDHLPEMTAVAASDLHRPYIIRQRRVLVRVQNDSLFHTRRVGIP